MNSTVSSWSADEWCTITNQLSSEQWQPYHKISPPDQQKNAVPLKDTKAKQQITLNTWFLLKISWIIRTWECVLRRSNINIESYGRDKHVSGKACVQRSLFGDLVHGMRKVSHIAGADASHRYTSVLRQVDRKLFRQTLNLQMMQCLLPTLYMHTSKFHRWKQDLDP